MVLTLSGQLKLLKIVPDNFLFATIRGAHPSGQLKLLKIVPDNFLFATIHGAYPSGQRLALFKIAPGNFVFAVIHDAHPKGHRRFAPMLTIAPCHCLFATTHGAIRPVGRATAAQSGIAKLLAMLFPPSPFGPAKASASFLFFLAIKFMQQSNQSDSFVTMDTIKHGLSFFTGFYQFLPSKHS